MKFSRTELIRAKNVQLHAVGLNRTNNPGWLKKAMEREFTEREIAQFHFATHTTKEVGNFIISTPPKDDANVNAVRAKLRDRARTGLRKYGVTTERADVDLLGWCKHLQEELLDAAVYLEAAMRKLENPK